MQQQHQQQQQRQQQQRNTTSKSYRIICRVIMLQQKIFHSESRSVYRVLWSVSLGDHTARYGITREKKPFNLQFHYFQ